MKHLTTPLLLIFFCIFGKVHASFNSLDIESLIANYAKIYRSPLSSKRYQDRPTPANSELYDEATTPSDKEAENHEKVFNVQPPSVSYENQLDLPRTEEVIEDLSNPSNLTPEGTPYQIDVKNVSSSSEEKEVIKLEIPKGYPFPIHITINPSREPAISKEEPYSVVEELIKQDLNEDSKQENLDPQKTESSYNKISSSEKLENNSLEPDPHTLEETTNTPNESLKPKLKKSSKKKNVPRRKEPSTSLNDETNKSHLKTIKGKKNRGFFREKVGSLFSKLSSS